MKQTVSQPKHRSALRAKLGRLYYAIRRRLLWIKMRKDFAYNRSGNLLPHTYTSHRTLLLRRLKDVDMWLQENKVVNLQIASKKLDGILLRPGETFSYWRLIGKPSKRKGYLPGMILQSGGFTAGTGGGLCQMSNLIFWMTLHTPLTVVERHRHSYDVFPDSNRTQPFGSGATCFYPHGDLMIRNDTSDTYQLVVKVGKTHLEGQWRVSNPPEYRYEIEERNHSMNLEYWGGYTRHNELFQKQFDLQGNLLDEHLVVENNAIMMYAPFLENAAEN